ncbi:MAG: hypothetical protein IKK89_01705 [Alistipes sp.]|nr:hypothetical protein [Alistipes sp.]MBR6630646.1 hypothetical protein [Alistipes sp.]
MKDIIKVFAVGLIVVAVAGCEKFEPMAADPTLPDKPTYNVIGTPKKTITIKRKKPTIGNPSPRPLSADYETLIEDYNEYNEYE